MLYYRVFGLSILLDPPVLVLQLAEPASLFVPCPIPRYPQSRRCSASTASTAMWTEEGFGLRLGLGAGALIWGGTGLGLGGWEVSGPRVVTLWGLWGWFWPTRFCLVLPCLDFSRGCPLGGWKGFIGEGKAGVGVEVGVGVAALIWGDSGLDVAGEAGSVPGPGRVTHWRLCGRSWAVLLSC